MIWLIQPLAAGNALRVLLAPATGASRWRLLRKDVDAFSGWDDATALVVFDGNDAKAITDVSGLINGEQVFYRLYSLVDAAWVDSGVSVAATPTADMVDLGTDVLELVRSRLEAGFKVYCDRGTLKIDSGFIPVLNASPQVEETPLPIVTVHLQNQGTEVRGIGEMIAVDVFDDDTAEWLSVEGGLDRVQLTIVCWSINSDTRIVMRKALRAILQANLPVWDAAGLVTPSWSMQDLEDYQTYQVPMFQTVCTLDCLAPAAVQTSTPPIVDAEAALATAI
jgi:hypothetical protein